MNAPAAKFPSRPLQAAPISDAGTGEHGRERGRLDPEVAEDAEDQHAMFRATATIPMYLVSVGSTWLRFIARRMTAITRPISQRPTIQNAIAVQTFDHPSSIKVVPMKS